MLAVSPAPGAGSHATHAPHTCGHARAESRGPRDWEGAVGCGHQNCRCAGEWCYYICTPLKNNNTNSAAGRPRRRKKCARRAREKTHHCKSYVRVHISVVQPGGESGRSRIRSRAEPLRPCMQAEEFAHACPGGPAVQLAGVRCERPTPRKSEEAARMAVGSPSGSTCPHETSVRIVSCHCEER